LSVRLFGTSESKPEFPIWTPRFCIVRFSCPGHSEFAAKPTPSQIGNWWEGSWLQKNLLFDGRYRVTAKHAGGFVDTSYLED
jgi:hypothetical protein